jgi:hypothetical protein
MTTTTTSAALIPVAPVFTNTERLTLAGFLAGYSGLTREAYELDLRQYASWCHQHHLRLFQARRADIECFARDLEVRGRARATSPAGCAPSPGSTGMRWKRTFSIIHPPRMSAGRGWIMSRTSPGWTVTSWGRRWSARPLLAAGHEPVEEGHHRPPGIWRSGEPVSRWAGWAGQ